MKLQPMLIAGLLALSVAGCSSNQTASFMINGNEQALTLELYKPNFWSDWEQEIIVRNFPDCQRRHTLKPTADESPKIEIYSAEPYVFILKQNKRWYVTELKSCRFQAFKEAPPEPGVLIGTFQEKDGGYRFTKAPAAPGG